MEAEQPLKEKVESSKRAGHAWPTYSLPIEGPYAAEVGVESMSNTTLSELYERATVFIDARHDVDGNYIYKNSTDHYGTDTQAIVDKHLLVTPAGNGRFTTLPLPVVPTPVSELLSENNDTGLVQAMIEKERGGNYNALACVNVKSTDYTKDTVAEYLLLSAQKLAWMKGVIGAPTVALLDPDLMIKLMRQVSLDESDSSVSLSEVSQSTGDETNIRISRTSNTNAIQVFSTTLITDNRDDTVKGATIPFTFGLTFRLVAVLDKTGALRYDALGRHAPSVAPEALSDGDKLLYTTEIFCDPFDHVLMKFMRVFENVRKMDLDNDPYAYQEPQRYRNNLNLAVVEMMREIPKTMDNLKQLTAIDDYLRKCVELAESQTLVAPTIMTDLAARAGEIIINEYYNGPGLPQVTAVCAWGRTHLVLTPRMGWLIDEPVVFPKKMKDTDINTEALDLMWKAYKEITDEKLDFYQHDPQQGVYRKVGYFETTFEKLSPAYSKLDLLYSINWAAWVHHVKNPQSIMPLEMMRYVYDMLALESKEQFQDLLTIIAIIISRFFIINVIECLKYALNGPIAYGLVMKMLDTSSDSSEQTSIEAFNDYYQMVAEQALRELNLPFIGDLVFRAVLESWPLLRLRQLIWDHRPSDPNNVMLYPPFTLPDATLLEQGVPSPAATLYDIFIDELKRMQVESPETLTKLRLVPKNAHHQVLWNDFSRYKLFLLRRQETGMRTPGKFSFLAFVGQASATLSRKARQEDEIRYTAKVDHKNLMFIYDAAVRDTLAIMNTNVKKMIEDTGHYIAPKNSIRSPGLSPVSLLISALVITQHLMDYSAYYPRGIIQSEFNLTGSVQRGHSALITLINHRDAVVIPKQQGEGVLTTSLHKWHRALVSPLLISPKQRELYIISHLVNGSNMTISNLAAYTKRKSTSSSSSSLESSQQESDPSTQSESGSVDARHLTKLTESGLMACIMERTFNHQGIKRDSEPLQRLLSPMQIAPPPLSANETELDLYYPWTLQYEERLSIFIAAMGFSLGLDPSALPNKLPLLEAQRLQQLLRSECDPTRNRAFGLLSGMASFFEGNIKSTEKVRVNGMEIPPSMQIVGFEKTAREQLNLFDFGFDDTLSSVDHAEWLHSIVAGLYLVCMTLSIDVLRLTSPIAWLAAVCASSASGKFKRGGDLEVIDILLESYFGTLLVDENAAPFAVYYLNLPVLYADEFDAGSFRGEVFQTLHSFLRAKDVDYTDIDNYESVKQSVRNIDISRFVKFHPNSTKKSKNEYEVRREQRLVYWIMRFKERTTTIPSVVSIIRQIMSVDM